MKTGILEPLKDIVIENLVTTEIRSHDGTILGQIIQNMAHTKKLRTPVDKPRTGS